MKGIDFLHRTTNARNPKKVLAGRSRSIKHSVLATTLALTFCVMLPISNGILANSSGEPSPITMNTSNGCADLGLFAFPTAPKQGDTVTVFVSVTNDNTTDASFVVETSICDGTMSVVSRDERVVAVPAQSTGNFQIILATSASSRPGAYTIISKSYRGETLPPRLNYACSATYFRFNLACNSNNCAPEN